MARSGSGDTHKQALPGEHGEHPPIYAGSQSTQGSIKAVRCSLTWYVPLIFGVSKAEKHSNVGLCESCNL